MLKRIDHVGVIVDDLEEGKRFLTDVLGLSLDREFDQKDRGSKVAFFRCGDTEIELIEVADRKRSEEVREGKPARIDHIAFEVDDLSSTVANLGRSGIETTEMEPRRLGAATSYWTKPETSDGVAYQLTQKDTVPEAR